MGATEEFRTAVRAETVELDRSLLLVAAHDHELDVEAELLRLDALAAGVDERTVDGVRDHLFGRVGFLGDRETYDAADNSHLDRVLERRRGMPILLSVVMIEVARRLGVGIDGVGAPGHFLVRSRSEPHRFFDPFAGGVELSADDCRARHEAAGFGPWDDAHLEPVGPLPIVARVLNNLLAGHRRRQARSAAATVASLATMLPGAGPRELLTYVGTLAEAGRYDRAAATAELLATKLKGPTRDKVVAAAHRYRSALN